MISISVDKRKQRELVRAIQGLSNDLPREMAVVINNTVKRGVSLIAKEVQPRLAVSQKVIKKKLKTGSFATKKKLRSSVIMKYSHRLSLKEFKPTQKAAGTSYLSKSGRGMVPGAFMGPKPGVKAPNLNGHVFKRIGRSRLPITRLDAASPWGVVMKNSLTPVIVRKIQQGFDKEMDKRISAKIRKKMGKY